MLQSPTEAVLTLLPTIPSENLPQIAECLAKLSSGSSGALPALRPQRWTGKISSDEVWFVQELYERICENLQRRQQVDQEKFVDFQRRKRFTEQFLPAAQKAYAANSRWFPKQTKVHRLVMLRLYAELSVQRLLRERRSIEWHQISDVVSSLAETVDQSFPGYIQSGLLGTIVDALAQGKFRYRRTLIES